LLSLGGEADIESTGRRRPGKKSIKPVPGLDEAWRYEGTLAKHAYKVEKKEIDHRIVKDSSSRQEST
jgi:hypothetical protein